MRMSRIGRKPVPVPEAVTVEIAAGSVAVKGPKGELSQTVSPEMTIEQEDGMVTVVAARPNAASTAPCTASPAA